jgi:glycosyltransferase involved in cell wall biosynthesis
MQWSLRLADANIFICNYEFNLVRRFFTVRNPKMAYLAVDTQRYEAKKVGPICKRLLNVAWSGEENARRKCLYEIISAMPAILEAHPDATLMMAGREGKALPKLKELASRLCIDHAVQFTGELTLQQKVLEMQRAVLFLQPSMYEGFGSAVGEAMACGTAVACTLVGSLPEVIGNVGEQIAQPTAEGISSVVIQFLSRPVEEQQVQGVNGSVLVRRLFSYERRLNEIGLIVDEVSRRS